MDDKRLKEIEKALEEARQLEERINKAIAERDKKTESNTSNEKGMTLTKKTDHPIGGGDEFMSIIILTVMLSLGSGLLATAFYFMSMSF